MYEEDVPSELGHGVGEAEHAGADHGGDIVEGSVPPLGVPRRRDREPVVDRLLLRCPLILQNPVFRCETSISLYVHNKGC